MTGVENSLISIENILRAIAHALAVPLPVPAGVPHPVPAGVPHPVLAGVPHPGPAGVPLHE